MKNKLLPVLAQSLPTLTASLLSVFVHQQELTFEGTDLIMFLPIRSLGVEWGVVLGCLNGSKDLSENP